MENFFSTLKAAKANMNLICKQSSLKHIRVAGKVQRNWLCFNTASRPLSKSESVSMTVIFNIILQTTVAVVCPDTSKQKDVT